MWLFSRRTLAVPPTRAPSAAQPRTHTVTPALLSRPQPGFLKVPRSSNNLITEQQQNHSLSWVQGPKETKESLGFYTLAV